MTDGGSEVIIREFQSFIKDAGYPCVAARSAIAQNHIPCLVSSHMGCPRDDRRILRFIYDFVNEYRVSTEPLHSAAVLFELPEDPTEEVFDMMLWDRLQALSRLDAENFRYDKRVDSDPLSPHFSFSLGEEAFFIIGLSPATQRKSRQFKFPAMIFNPHAQFEELREENRYEKMKKIVRKRDTLFSGSVNPMLTDFGEVSEAWQYSGRQYNGDWTCPLKVTHEPSGDNTAAQQRRLHNEEGTASESGRH
jgi:uncharacterized protein